MEQMLFIQCLIMMHMILTMRPVLSLQDETMMLSIWASSHELDKAFDQYIST